MNIMNMQTIITCLRGTIGRWLKGKAIVIPVLVLVAMEGQAQNKFTIHGNFENVLEKIAQSGISVDSAGVVDAATDEVTARDIVKNGIFTIQGTVGKPYLGKLRLWASAVKNGERISRSGGDYPIIIEPGDIVFDANQNVPVISGTPLNDFIRDINGMDETDTDSIKHMIIQHKDDPVGVLLLPVLDAYLSEPDTILSLISQMSEDAQKNKDIIAIKEKAERILASPKVGDKFSDFAVEYEGKTTRLSDYVGRGQYVLVDFWASWCAPCRGEIPNLIAAYNKYKDKGLVVLGVAAWDEPEATKKAIEEDKIPYPQILNSQKIGTDIYGITGIPHIILFAPDGTILARRLRGEEIDKKLAEIFGNDN